MKWRQRLRGLAGAVVGITFVVAMISVAFFLTAFVYERIGFVPTALLAQTINVLLGFLLAFLILYMVGSIFSSKRIASQMGMFTPIIDALERIAKGDFSVHLDDNVHDRGLLGTLAKSVNTVALELNQIETLRQEFISNVSHEIQSPLTSIRGFARALQNDALSAADRLHYLTIIETESMRLSKLSDNLLALTSLESESIAVVRQPYRLDRQIRSVILACEPQWVEKAIDMDVSLAELTISADQDLLSQVWTNLIHNSIKFTPPGGSVRVELRRQGAVLVCAIADTGIGIAEEDQAHIFERFFKADRSREQAKGGSGLGLAIAQKIVHLHGGTIAVASRPGGGAVFSVALPVHE